MSASDHHPAIVKSLLWKNEADTKLFATKLAAQPRLREAFIELHGELGAGKTTLVRHLLHALGVKGLIKSPTYAVVESYSLNNFNIWHFDFYRFHDAREWEDAGFRDIFSATGLKLAEWPQRAASYIPTSDLLIRIQVNTDESRTVVVEAQTNVGRFILTDMGL